MLPEIAELEFEVEEFPEDLPPIGKSFLFDFLKGEFVMQDGKMIELYGIDSLKMWIEKTMRTERYRFTIYEDEENGVSIEDLIGSNYPRDFVESEIQREVTTSLEQHPHISAIENWQFERDGKRMKISFTVVTMEEVFEQEVTF